MNTGRGSARARVLRGRTGARGGTDSVDNAKPEYVCYMIVFVSI